MKKLAVSVHGYSALIAAAILATSQFVAPMAQADTWTNAAGTGLWNEAGNWDGNLVPVDYASVTIDHPTAGGTIDLGGIPTAALDTLTFNANHAFILTHGLLVTNRIYNGWLDQEIAANVSSSFGWLRLDNYTGSLIISGTIMDLPGSDKPTDVWGAGVLTGANTYTGRTRVNNSNTMEIRGAQGSILHTSALTVEGADLILNNTQQNNDHRIDSTLPITLRMADLTYLGSNTGPSSQVLGDITLKGGANSLRGNAGMDTTDPAAPINHSATLTLQSLTRELRATLVVNPNLSGTNPLVIQVNQVPTLTGHAGAAGSTDQSILPWAIGSDGALLTVDGTTPQLRPLNSSSEYHPVLSTAAAPDNVQVSESQTVNSSRTCNALWLNNTGQIHLAEDTQLTVTSGVISLAAEDSALTGATGSSLHFDDAEGIIHLFGQSRIEVPIVGNNGLTVSGQGRLTLTRPNPNLNGPLTINSSTVVSSVQGAVGQTPIAFHGTGTHQPGTILFDTVNQTIFSDITVDTMMDTSPSSGSYSAANLEVAADLTVTHTGGFSGRGLINKNGPGKMIFTGHSITDDFFFDIGEGTAQFDGYMEPNPNGGWITSYVYGRLTGTGTIKGQAIAYSGTIAPGHDELPGILRLNMLNVFNNGRLEFTLNGPALGTQYSQILIDDSTYEYTQVSLDSNSSFLDLVLNYEPLPGQSFELIDILGSQPINNTFKDLPEGGIYTAQFNNTAYGFQVSYVGGDGNDLVLTAVAVPEPASLTLLTGLSLLLLRRRNLRK